MAIRTISVFAKSGVTITRDIDGGAPNTGDVIANALWGNAFSWETPSDLSLTFSGPMTNITFEDSDGILSDNPYSGWTVTDQQLTQAVTINGQTYSPSTETIRWQNPPPVNVENEYEVTLFDDNGVAYRMVGVSITEGYRTDVVGVMFDGPAPPPGTTLKYIQGVSTYSGFGQTVTIPTQPICFLAGVLIETPTGPVPVDSLQIGDKVITLDDGPQPIRWIGKSLVCALGTMAPVKIRKGYLGAQRDLYLSPNHRVLLRSSKAELYFGEAEVLVPAKALVDDRYVCRTAMRKAAYYHLLLDRHHMVISDGIATESLFVGAVTEDVLGPVALQDLQARLREIDVSAQRLSRMSLTLREARYLLHQDEPAEIAGVSLKAA
ncbi:Hint domain-containing protein [Marivita sp. S0852]|uniref:Hint domain-containing protein n=1 Tax=Marivita sp. S0852 TaxID=3373893 RepID=UPI00398261A3